ncbi:unnamed protein product [Didymodactylos carnosus]|uniref:L-Fucosyltransferase n=1 Tax=Didymodactylos carnosus TaxID=1234261 RepID=A0A814X107_9BILA|nr:unnamed protein product [Didymodactylos carnosus]CAF3973441.1 unnamed protein product [Didymodactylos carnosus]
MTYLIDRNLVPSQCHIPREFRSRVAQIKPVSLDEPQQTISSFVSRDIPSLVPLVDSFASVVAGLPSRARDPDQSQPPSMNPMSNSCIIVLRSNGGRLGNKMFMYATAYGLTRMYHCSMYIERRAFDELRETFLVDPVKRISDEQFSNVKNKIQVLSNGCHYTNLSTVIVNSTILELTGYWQNYKYFVNYYKEIRHQFTLKKNILLEIDKYFTYSYKLRNATLVGVHVRRGDFLSQHNINVGFTVSSAEYINKSMTYFTTKYQNVYFIIASDDKTWCIETFGKQQNNNVLITPKHFTPSEDLAILTSCKHTIVTVGTFGWWAAFLTNGEVLCDKNYPRNGTWLSELCPGQEYYPPWYKSL